MMLLLSLFVLPFPALGQNNAADSQNLRALLEEVKQMRRDLQAAAVAAQRVQIMLYRLQLQDAAVARAARQVEEIQGKLADLTAKRQRVTLNINYGEDLRKRSQDAAEVHSVEEQFLPEEKRQDEQLAREEQTLRERQGEAERQLRGEQEKLDSLRALLDQLDHTLESAASPSANAAPAK
jgi:chromosome segregation ATPase